MELGYLQSSPPCGAQARIYPFSGFAITTERYGSKEKTREELILAPGHVKAQYLLRGAYEVHGPSGNLKPDHMPRQVPFNRSAHKYKLWKDTASPLTSIIEFT